MKRDSYHCHQCPNTASPGGIFTTAAKSSKKCHGAPDTPQSVPFWHRVLAMPEALSDPSETRPRALFAKISSL